MAKKLKTLFNLTTAELALILGYLNSILTVIDGRETPLSKSERGEAHARKDLKQFVHDSANVAEQNPHLIPADDTLENNATRLSLIRQIGEIFILNSKVIEILSDTEIAAAIDSYNFGMGVYDNAKQGKKRGEPGMDAICDLLGVYFKRKKTPPSPPNPA